MCVHSWRYKHTSIEVSEFQIYTLGRFTVRYTPKKSQSGDKVVKNKRKQTHCYVHDAGNGLQKLLHSWCWAWLSSAASERWCCGWMEKSVSTPAHPLLWSPTIAKRVKALPWKNCFPTVQDRVAGDSRGSSVWHRACMCTFEHVQPLIHCGPKKSSPQSYCC